MKFCSLLFGLVILQLFAVSSKAQPATMRVSEVMLRKAAVKSILPKYPPDSREHRVIGVAVASVLTNIEGEVERVEVLESPDASTGQALSLAIQQWKFIKSTLDGKPIRYRGKLTFYFEIDKHGNAKVRNPKMFR